MDEKPTAVTSVEESVDSEDESLAIDENPQEPSTEPLNESNDQIDNNGSTASIDAPLAPVQMSDPLKQGDNDNAQCSQINEESANNDDHDNAALDDDDDEELESTSLVIHDSNSKDVGVEPMDQSLKPANGGHSEIDEVPERIDEAPERIDEVPECIDEAPECIDEAPERIDEVPELSNEGPPPTDEGLLSSRPKDEDLEDGELSDEPDPTDGAPNHEPNTTQEGTELSEVSMERLTAENKPLESSSPDKHGRKRSRSVSSKDEDSKELAAAKDYTSESSTSSEEDRSERKRRKKEKRRRKKEKKRKEKEKEKARKKRRRQRSDSYGSYDRDSREREMNFTEPPPWQRMDHQRMDQQRMDQQRNNDDYGYDDYYGGVEQLPGPYDSPSPDPYASPPYSSDDDGPDLYSRVSDDFLDPTISANDREREIFKRRGMSDRKKAKKRAFFENLRERDRKREGRGGGRGGRSGKDDRQKCRFYQEGKCQKAERCIYSHNFIPAKKMEACKFFLQGYCAKSDMCIYLHSEVPCKFFHTGQKCFNNDNCKFSHEPLTESTKPLLEKAIILEETGSFKTPAVKPELLKKIVFGAANSNIVAVGNTSPSKKVQDKPQMEDTENEKLSPQHQSDSRERSSVSPSKDSNKPVTSLFDIAPKPSADMEEKLHKGLYDELAAIKSGGSDDEMSNETNHHPLTRPGGFYSETLKSPHRKTKSRWDSKSRWDEKTNPNLTPLGDRKQALLPTPSKNNTSPENTPTAVTSSMTTQAAVNIILSAIRSHSTSSSSSGATDPRVSAKVADPRLSTANDPRLGAQSDLPKDPRQDARHTDPRQSDHQQPNRTENRPLDPRAAKPSDPRTSDPRLSSSQEIKTPLLPDPRIGGETIERRVRPEPPRPAPTINGKPTKPMNWLLKPITYELQLTYLPSGYDVNQEESSVKDPRIKKRIQSLKSGAREQPPKLPDITAELQRMQNLQNKTNQTSESKTRPVSYLPETSSFKPKSIVKSRLSSQADSADGDEDENSLKIDMQEEDKASVTT